MFGFIIALFDYGELEVFILFQNNYQVTLKTSVSIAAGEKIQYLHTLLCGEAFCEFEIICEHIHNSNITRLNHILLFLDTYFSLLNLCQSQSAQCTVERLI